MVVDVKPQVTIDYSESKVKQLLARYRKAKAVKDQWTPILKIVTNTLYHKENLFIQKA